MKPCGRRSCSLAMTRFPTTIFMVKFGKQKHAVSGDSFRPSQHGMSRFPVSGWLNRDRCVARPCRLLLRPRTASSLIPRSLATLRVTVSEIDPSDSGLSSLLRVLPSFAYPASCASNTIAVMAATNSAASRSFISHIARLSLPCSTISTAGAISPPKICRIRHHWSMSTDAQLIVHFSCPHCAALYSAIQEQRDGRHPGDFHCRGCGTQVHEWTGLYNFVNWQPVAISRKKRTRRPLRRTDRHLTG